MMDEHGGGQELQEDRYRECHPVAQGVTAEFLSIMRMYGVRRENVRLNIGTDGFAFNKIQRQFLPFEYRPHGNACGAKTA